MRLLISWVEVLVDCSWSFAILVGSIAEVVCSVKLALSGVGLRLSLPDNSTTRSLGSYTGRFSHRDGLPRCSQNPDSLVYRSKDSRGAYSFGKNVTCEIAPPRSNSETIVAMDAVRFHFVVYIVRPH